MIDRTKYVKTNIDAIIVYALEALTADDPNMQKAVQEALQMYDNGKTVEEITKFLEAVPPNEVEKLKIKFKKLHPDTALPKQGTSTDAGYDIVAVDDGTWDKDGRYIEYRTGLAVALPSGYHLKAAPRSSNSKYDLLLCNSEGLIDNAYRGEIKLRFKYVMPSIITENVNYKEGQESLYGHKFMYSFVKSPSDLRIYKKGDRIAQLKIEKTIYADFEEVAELDQTDRNEGGFGSTGT